MVRKSKKNGNYGTKMILVVSPDALRYRGPIALPSARMQCSTYTVLLAYTGALSSTGAGVIANTFGTTNPSACSNWSSLVAVFDEYRVLKSELHFRPNNQYSKTSTVCVPGYVVLDRDSTGALGSAGSAVGYESNKEVDLENPWKISYEMDGVRESGFITTASPLNLGAFLTYFSGLSLSTQYGVTEHQFLVQFRGST